MERAKWLATCVIYVGVVVDVADATGSGWYSWTPRTHVRIMNITLDNPTSCSIVRVVT